MKAPFGLDSNVHVGAVIFFGVVLGWYIALTFGPERSHGWMAAVRSWCNLRIWNRQAVWEVNQLVNWSWSLAESQGWLDQMASALSQYSLPLFLPLIVMQRRGAAVEVS